MQPATARIGERRYGVRAALVLLRWLDAEGHTLAACTQCDLDRWLADGPSTRYQARKFVQWAVERGYASNIQIPDPGGRTQTRPLAEERRWALARQLLNDPTIATTDRIAGLFILLYAQPLTTIARLTTDRILVRDTGVYVAFGEAPLLLLKPIADLVTQHLAARHSHAIVGRNRPSPWLFPGMHPDHHISERHPGARLKRLGIYAHPGRHAALLALSTQLPAAVLSRLLGISAAVADRWVSKSGNSWAGYATAIQQRHRSQPP